MGNFKMGHLKNRSLGRIGHFENRVVSEVIPFSALVQGLITPL